MRDPSPETFERAFAGFSLSARAAFVADLWAARGWETRIDNDGSDCHVVCTRGDEQLVIRVAATTKYERLRRAGRTRLRRGEAVRSGRDAEERTHSSVDIVVTADSNVDAGSRRRGTDARVYDARSLYDLALYGLARGTANDLFQRHLGTNLTVSPAPTPVPDEDRATDSAGRSWFSGLGADTVDTSLGLRTLVAIVGVVALVSALVVGGVWSGGTGGAAVTDTSDRSLDTSDASTRSASGSGVSDGFDGVDPLGTGPPDGPETDTTPSGEPLVAPGLTADGLTGPNVLAAAHAEQVDGRSYVWRVTYTEQSGGTSSRATATHRVRNASVHRVDIETTGVITTDPGRLVPRPAYADGDRRHVLSEGRVLQRAVESRDHYAGHAEAAFSRLLRANESTVSDGRVGSGSVLYQVSLTGSPDSDKRQFRAVLFVTPEGVLTFVDAQWVDRDANVTVSVRSTYDFVDDPNVTRPEWMRPATTVRPTSSSSTNATTGSPTPTPGA